MKSRTLYTVGSNVSPELSDAKSHALQNLKSTEWKLAPGKDITATSNQVEKDVDRFAFKIKGEDFQATSEYARYNKYLIAVEEAKTKNIPYSGDVYTKEQATADWFRRALFNGNQEKFERFYNNKPNAPAAFNFHRLWNQAVIGVFALPLLNSTANIKEVNKQWKNNTLTMTIDQGKDNYYVDLDFKDDTIVGTAFYNRMVLKENVTTNGAYIREVPIPGSLKFQLELVEDGFQITNIDPSNPLIEDLITHDVVDVIKWLKSAEETKSETLEAGFFAVASTMHDEQKEIQDSYYDAQEKQAQEVLARRAASEATRKEKQQQKDKEYTEKLNSTDESIASYATNSIQPEMQAIITDIKKLISAPDKNPESKYYAIETLIENNLAIFEKQRDQNTDDLIDALRKIFSDVIRENAAEMHLKQDALNRAAEQKRHEEREAEILKAAEKAQNDEAKLKVLERVCDNEIRELSRDIVDDIKKNFPTILRDPLVLTLLITDSANLRDQELINKKKILETQLIPTLSKNTVLALEKYRVFKNIRVLIVDNEFSTKERLNFAKVHFNAYLPLLELKRGFLHKVLTTLFGESFTNKITSASFFRPKSARIADNVINTIDTPRRRS